MNTLSMHPGFHRLTAVLALLATVLSACSLPTPSGPTATPRVPKPCTRTTRPRAPNFTVNCMDDDPDFRPGDGFCEVLRGSGICTLRAAIEEADARPRPAPYTIQIQIGSGPQTIAPASPLPEITTAVIIDGTSQLGYAGTPLIELDGSGAGPDANGLDITAGDTTIKGLEIHGFDGAGIQNAGGLNLAGVTVQANSAGGIRGSGTGLTIADSLIHGNGGTGIESFRSFGPAVPVTLTDTDVIANAGTGFHGINAALTVTGGSFSQNGDGGIFNMVSLTLSGVKVINNYSQSYGGGISAINITSASLNNVTISANTAADSGGGIYYWGLAGGQLTVTDSTITNNFAPNKGGGIDVEAAKATLDATIVTGNRTLTGWDEKGGGVFVGVNNNASLNVIDGSVIGQPGDGNKADLGGGIYSYGIVNIDTSSVLSNTGEGIFSRGQSITLTDSQIAGNTGTGVFSVGTTDLTMTGGSVVGNGNQGIAGMRSMVMSDVVVASNGFGGILFDGSGSATLDRISIIYNNTAKDGGGLHLQGATANQITLRNVTISDNGADGSGGGLVALGPPGSISLVNVTVAQNWAGAGGGVFSSGGAVSAVNSLFADNQGGNCAGVVISHGHNLDSGTSCGLAATGDQSNANPLLGPLQDNGGSTLTHALLPGSPAIDAADNANCPATDQRGVARPQGAACDIGAFEVQPGGGLSSPTPNATAPGPAPASSVKGKFTQNANCRKGPGTVYDVLTSLPKGQEAAVEARNTDGGWWWVFLPGIKAHCWVSSITIELLGDPSGLPIMQAPPTPTTAPATSTPTPTIIPTVPADTPTPTETPTPELK